jgi:hypothetical protein
MKKSFIEKWFKQSNSIRFIEFAEYAPTKEIPNISFKHILRLENRDLKPFTKDLLHLLEESEKHDEQELVDEFKTLKGGILAYLQFQDCMLLQIDSSDIFNRHYCYYESIMYLKESVKSLIEGNVLSSLTLLRPFMELSIYNIYWCLRNNLKSSSDFFEWINGSKEKPPFKNILNYIFDNLEVASHINKEKYLELREYLYRIYKGLCVYQHTPRINESLVPLSFGNNRPSIVTFSVALTNLNILLRQIIYLYTLSFPLILFPVDSYKKFGFSGPVGLFADHSNFNIICAYLGEANIQLLKNQLKETENIQVHLNWFDSLEELTDNELEESWNSLSNHMSIDMDFDIKALDKMLIYFKAHMRSMSWMLNYFYFPDSLSHISDEFVKKAFESINNWR